eukprot:6961948-Prymnesium_polylepis.1
MASLIGCARRSTKRKPRVFDTVTGIHNPSSMVGDPDRGRSPATPAASLAEPAALQSDSPIILTQHGQPIGMAIRAQRRGQVAARS